MIFPSALRNSPITPTQERSYRLFPRWFPLIVVLLGGILFVPALFSFFHADDFTLLLAVKRNGPFGLWTSFPAPFLRPVISLSLYGEYRLWGLTPLPFHVTNIALHLINAVLVTAISSYLYASSRHELPFTTFAGLIFLTFPFHAEAVCWVSGRTDVMTTLFALLSLYSAFAYTSSGRPLFFFASPLCFLLALFSKESVLLLPFCLLFLGKYAPDRGEPQRWRQIIGVLFLLLPVYLAVRFTLLHTLLGGYGAHTHLQITPLRFIESILWFCQAGILPTLPRSFLAYLLLVLLVIGVIMRRLRNASLPALLWPLLLCFIVALLPAVTLGPGSADGMGGRLSYFPSVFSALLLPVLVRYLFSAKYCRPFLIGAISVYSLCLLLLSFRWYQAGNMGQRLLHSATVIPTPPTAVLAVPDNLFPAYVFRNGFPEAIQLFVPNRSEAVTVYSTYYAYSPEDTAMAECTGTDCTVRVHYTNHVARGFEISFPEGVAGTTPVAEGLSLRYTVPRPISPAVVIAVPTEIVRIASPDPKATTR